jgi:DNA-binding transcriptional regulator YiaG
MSHTWHDRPLCPNLSMTRQLKMTNRQFRNALSQLGLSQSELARQIGMTARTVRRWAAGEKLVPKVVEELLKAWEELGRDFGGE